MGKNGSIQQGRLHKWDNEAWNICTGMAYAFIFHFAYRPKPTDLETDWYYMDKFAKRILPVFSYIFMNTSYTFLSFHEHIVA